MPEFLSSARSVRFGVFEVDLRYVELRKSGIKVRLQGEPFVLLITLLKQHGEVVTREELRRALWPGDTFVDFDHSLGAAINNFAKYWGIQRQIRASLRRCRDAAIGLSLRSNQSARVKLRRLSAHLPPIHRNLQRENCLKPEILLRFTLPRPAQ